jgi:hypothetical protein
MAALSIDYPNVAKDCAAKTGLLVSGKCSYSYSSINVFDVFTSKAEFELILRNEI